MHKPRLSLTLNKIIQKEKKKKKNFTKFALPLTLHFSDTFFLYFRKTFKGATKVIFASATKIGENTTNILKCYFSS